MVVVDSLVFKVIHTPGHSPGSVCIIIDKYLVSGDLISGNSIGRTDLIGSNSNDMISSLGSFLRLPDSLIVLPGHGLVTSIKTIKDCNPYAKLILQQD